MDPETRTLLKALVDGQVKLAEGQARHDLLLVRHAGAIAKLARGQAQLHTEVTRLVKAQARTERVVTQLGHDVRELTVDVRQLGKRMGNYAKAVVRGFSTSAKRNGTLVAKVQSLDARVTRLEQK